MGNFLLRFRFFIKRLINTLCLIQLKPNSYVFVQMSVKWKGLSLQKYNFGDDLNVFLLEELTGKKVLKYGEFLHLRKCNILAIGSIVENYSNKDSIIWGSGAIEGEKKIVAPHKVCAVRGPLTQKFLEETGVKVPHVYGDPALLLPLIYNPHNIEKKYKMGIIPHYVDYKLPYVEEFRKEHPEILFIDLQNYKKWHDIIDQILSCEKIISSSLHGLILSDAYGIPNIRVNFSDKIVGGNFKYDDYNLAVRQCTIEPIVFNGCIETERLDSNFQSYRPIKIDVKKMLTTCPFTIKDRFMNPLCIKYNNK